MKKLKSRKWVVPVASLVFVLCIGTVAFAATGTSATTTQATVGTAATATTATAASETTTTQATGDVAEPANTDKGSGKQCNDETAVTGDTLAQVTTAALAAAGSGSTLTSATNETDSSDSSITYEAFVTKSDGTSVKMYLDASFKVVSTENAQQGGRGQRGEGPGRAKAPTSRDSSSAPTNASN